MVVNSWWKKQVEKHSKVEILSNSNYNPRDIVLSTRRLLGYRSCPSSKIRLKNRFNIKWLWCTLLTVISTTIISSFVIVRFSNCHKNSGVEGKTVVEHILNLFDLPSHAYRRLDSLTLGKKNYIAHFLRGKPRLKCQAWLSMKILLMLKRNDSWEGSVLLHFSA